MTPHALSALALIPLSLFTFTANFHATPNRGTWFWGSTTVPTGSSPHGSSVVVGDSAKEDAEIAFMTTWGVTKVYGSYGAAPGNPSTREPYRIWNTKLDAAGIESQLLISAFDPGAEDTELTDPVALLMKVQKRVIDFNNDTTSADQMFDALHLDVEPQTLDDWDDGSFTDRRGYLDDLLQFYVDTRALLDGAGYSWLPIYADIPWNWSKYPSTTIDWDGMPDRNGWYAAVNAVLDGVSIMVFTESKDTFDEIADSTEFERTVGFPGKCRVAIQALVGPGEIWDTWAEFMGIVGELEDPADGFGTDGATDIENYAFWRYSHTTYAPMLATSGMTFSVDAAHDLATISFPATPGYVYTLRHNTDLGGNWQDIATVRTTGQQRREERHLDVELSGRPRGFFSMVETPANADPPR